MLIEEQMIEILEKNLSACGKVEDQNWKLNLDWESPIPYFDS